LGRYKKKSTETLEFVHRRLLAFKKRRVWWMFTYN